MDAGDFMNFLNIFVVVISSGLQGSYGFVEDCSCSGFCHC